MRIRLFKVMLIIFSSQKFIWGMFCDIIGGEGGRGGERGGARRNMCTQCMYITENCNK